jgi:hypothetical protein
MGTLRWHRTPGRWRRRSKSYARAIFGAAPVRSRSCSCLMWGSQCSCTLRSGSRVGIRCRSGSSVSMNRQCVGHTIICWRGSARILRTRACTSGSSLRSQDKSPSGKIPGRNSLTGSCRRACGLRPAGSLAFSFFVLLVFFETSRAVSERVSKPAKGCGACPHIRRKAVVRHVHGRGFRMPRKNGLRPKRRRTDRDSR